MKIAFVLDDGMDRLDGVQQYMLTNGRWLSENGHEVHYLVGETKRTDIPNLHSLSKNLHVRFNKNRASIPVKIDKRRIKELLDNEKYDIMHIQMPYSPVLSGYVIKNAPSDAAVFGTFHILPYSDFQLAANKFFSKTLKSSLKRFDDFISVSKPASEFAKQSLGLASEVVPNSIDSKAFKTKLVKHKETQIVFLGRLVERKGALELLMAVNELRKLNKLSNIKVIIGGTGPLEPKLKAFVKDNGLQAAVRFSGFIPEADKPKFLGGADIAVFPSLGGESFGIVLIEAMAADSGVVLGGDNPGYRSVLEDNDFIINPANTREFANRLHLIANNSALRASLHKRQQAQVKKFDINVNGPKLINYYQKALQKREGMR